MKVLLANPCWDGRVSRKGTRVNRHWTPLDLLTVAALFEKRGIQVDVVDGRMREQDLSALVPHPEGYDKIFVTSTPLDRWQCPNLEVDLFCQQVKNLRHADVHIWGAHGTHFPDQILTQSGARTVIQGEPEGAALDIVDLKPFHQIAGIAFNENGRVVVNEPRPLSDLSTLPPPAYHHVNLDNYYYEILGERFVLLEATRGCPHACTFCMREMYGQKAYRYKTPRQVAIEVEAAVRKAGARCGKFMDLEFTLNRDYILEVCQELMPFRNEWKWSCQTRADQVDLELLRAMKAAGCTLVHFGVETGSPKVLDRIVKNSSLKKISDGVAMALEAGLEVACFYMAGFPGETDEDRQMTVDFAKQLNATYSTFQLAIPYPGTPLWAAQQWKELYPESFYEGADIAKLKQWQKNAYRSYYLRPRYILNHLKRFKGRQAFQQLSLLRELIGFPRGRSLAS